VPKERSKRQERQSSAENYWATEAQEMMEMTSVRIKVLPPVILAAACLTAVLVYLWISG
jgi:hypothetical protein